MGTITNAQVIYGLKATGSPTKTAISGLVTIGVPQSNPPLDGDIAYAFNVTSTGAADAVQWTQDDGAVVATNGAPVIIDAGVDFEGQPLETAATRLAVFAQAPTSNVLPVTFGSTNATAPGTVWPGQISLITMNDTLGSPSVDINFANSGDSVTIVCIASTT